ncbi:Endoplasmic reticulum junction formation protein lunapark [Acropora cervicornis]|uniref:Endoplasmic reticulum junction formation protein lunapark n=1 Tax=Acropora cervicornis TaxID=6130 RepID=A0AAD9QPH4_ACRCE|nr:Endoplasmic reticulum junction formation protein lunapark [Acropora cervicornis]
MYHIVALNGKRHLWRNRYGFTRVVKKESLGEVLESLEKDLKALESNLQRTEQLRRKFIGSLVLYSILLYILAALVCYFYDFPKSWKAKIVRSIPLLVFPLVVYSLKRVLHYVFVSRISKKARRLEQLKDRKRQVLEEVMEKETYKAAKDLLDKYDPNSEILKVERKITAPTSPVAAVMQSPQGTIGTELRQRNLSSKTESPGAPALQRTFSEPSLLESPAQLNQSHDSRVVNRSVEVRKSSSLMDITLSKSEYLVGDGPNNRFALICSQCCSHNGMALKEEFEYTVVKRIDKAEVNGDHRQQTDETKGSILQ